MRQYKFKLLAFSLLASAFAVSTLWAPAAQAAAYTPQGLCGGGYYVQRSHALPNARVYQLYNGSHNCVVTIKTGQLSQATTTTAGLQVEGQNWSYDTGNYTSYAGPVKQLASGKCVRYFGFHGGESFTSAWGNCK